MEIKKLGDYYYVEIMVKDNCGKYFCESIAAPEKKKIIDLFGEDVGGINYFGAVRIPWNDNDSTYFQSWKYLYCIKYVNNGTTLLVSKSQNLLQSAMK